MQPSFIKSIIILLTAILFAQCSTDPFEPIDIFEEEMISVDADGNVVDNGENVLLPVGQLCDGVQLFANKERVQEVPGGFQIKGTVFAETEEGITSISSGDFEISNTYVDQLEAFSGFGSFLLPEVGSFKGNVDLADLFGAHLKYGSGGAFKNKDEQLPLVDGDCYFQMTLEESSGFAPGTPAYPLMIKNTAMSFNTMYIQPEIPAILVKGDMDQYEVKDKPARVSEGANGKKKFKPASTSVKKKFSIKDVHIGLAASPHFIFTPHTFSDELEEIVGGTGFEEFQGQLYLKGRIPLKKYPIDIIGEAVVTTPIHPEGIMNVLEGSFEDASYEIGINGTAEFGHAMLDFLPLDTRVELGNATVQMKAGLDESFLRFAGEYDTDILGDILGEELSELIPRQTQSGKIYGNVGTDLSEWQYYFESKMSMHIPGIGEQELRETIIHVTPEQIFMSSMATLPFGIGETEIIGELKRDGSFLLSGRAEAQLELGDAKMAADLLLEITNEGVILDGMASLPGGISDFKISGEVNKDRIAVSGSQMTNINFGGGARLKTDLSLAASTDTGIRLFGAMETPLDVTMIEVEGIVSAQGLSLSGTIDNNVNFGVTKLDADLTLKASTWGGAKLKGKIDLPLKHIGGNIDVTGCINGVTSFTLNANAGIHMDFGPTAAEVAVCYRFTQSDIKIGGNANFTWDKDDDSGESDSGGLGVIINPNWGNRTVTVCVEIPVLGEHCL